MASGTSKKTELKLIGVVRASLEELLLDYEDFLRQKGMKMWSKDDERVVKIRGIGYKPNRSFETYVFCFKHPELAANAIICLIHQADNLLDRQLGRLEKDFLDLLF